MLAATSVAVAALPFAQAAEPILPAADPIPCDQSPAPDVTGDACTQANGAYDAAVSQIPTVPPTPPTPPTIPTVPTVPTVPSVTPPTIPTDPVGTACSTISPETCTTVNGTSVSSPLDAVAITSPADQSTFHPGDTVTIAWTATGADPLSSNFVVEVSNGTTWTTIADAQSPYNCTSLHVGGTSISCSATWTVGPSHTIYQIAVALDPAALAYDSAGQPGLDAAACQLGANCATVTVKSSSGSALRIDPVGSVPSMVPNGQEVTLTYSITYDIPVAQRGQAAVGAAFSLKDAGSSVCARMVPSSGIVSCKLTSTNHAGVLAASVASTAKYDGASLTNGIVWTDLQVLRVQANDTPRTDLFANPSEVYAPAFKVLTTYNNKPLAGAIVTLHASDGDASDSTGKDGITNVGVSEPDTMTVAYTTDASFQTLLNTGPSLSLTWTKIDMSALAPNDGFVDVGDLVTFTGTASYDHDHSAVATGTVDLGPGAPADCHAEKGTIVNGAVTLAVRCSTVHQGALPVVVNSTDLGITTLSAPATATATWTTVTVSNVVYDNFTNVGDSVAITGSATYAHDGSNVPSGVLALDTTTAPCTLVDGTITNGALLAHVQCTDVTTKILGLHIASASNGVENLTSAVTISGVWTTITVSKLTNDKMVNVGDTVTLTGTAVYAHDGSKVPDATLSLDPLAPSACSLLSGAIANGVVTAKVVCSAVTDASAAGVPIVVASGHGDVTKLTSPLALKSIWTTITVTGLVVSDGIVNVNDSVTFTGTATYAHDGTNVPWANLAFGPGVPADCLLLTGNVSAGNLKAVIACHGVHDFSNAKIPLLVSSGHEDVANLTSSPLKVGAIWTTIDIAGAAVSDGLVNVSDTVTMTGTATYAHDHSLVGSATIRAVTLPSGCVENGGVSNGALTVTISCSVVQDSSKGIPLAIAAENEGVLNLTAPLTFSAIWTQVQVSYTTDTAPGVLAPNAPVVYTATVTFAHNNAPVENGVVLVQSDAAGDTDQFVCITGDASSGSPGTCSVEVTKNLGAFTFHVTAFSTRQDSQHRLVPVVTNMANTPATMSYRWTAIGFLPYQCSVDNQTWGSCSGPFSVSQLVWVRTQVVASDTGAVLPGAKVSLNRNNLTADSQGYVVKSFTAFRAGGLPVVARGISATIDGQTVTWTIPHSETLSFQ